MKKILSVANKKYFLKIMLLGTAIVVLSCMSTNMYASTTYYADCTQSAIQQGWTQSWSCPGTGTVSGSWSGHSGCVNCAIGARCVLRGIGQVVSMTWSATLQSGKWVGEVHTGLYAGPYNNGQTSRLSYQKVVPSMPEDLIPYRWTMSNVSCILGVN